MSDAERQWRTNAANLSPRLKPILLSQSFNFSSFLHSPPSSRSFFHVSSFVPFSFTYGHVHSPNDNIKVLCIVRAGKEATKTGRSFISAPVVSDRERRIREAATNRYWRPLRTRDAARLSFLLKHRYVHSNTANFRPHCSGVIIDSCRSILQVDISRDTNWTYLIYEKINR